MKELKKLPRQKKARFTPLAGKPACTDICMNPPCELQVVVIFKNGKCPYSRHSSCGQCIKDEWDLFDIRFLAEAHNFGLA